MTALTYSFPTSAAQYGNDYPAGGEPFNNFEAFNAQQIAAVRVAFAAVAGVSNMSFTEQPDESAGAADLRFAMSDSVGTAAAYLPNPDPRGGDSWFNNSSGQFDAPRRGNYAWATVYHEIGHALGLKHPHEVDAAYGLGTMSAAFDSMEFTIMSYRAYAGQPAVGYSNEQFGFAQTLMMYDIAALQHLYGADFTYNGGNTTYRWDPGTGELSINGVGEGAPGANRVFMTVWDGGGEDLYDFSLYATNLSVSLAPGGWSTTSATQLALLGLDAGAYKFARGNIANALLFEGNTASLIENVTGGSGNDVITGNSAVNKLNGGAGNDTLDGGAGADILTGGSGNDVYLFDDAGDQAIELADGGTDEVRTSTGSKTDYTKMFKLPDFVEDLLGTSAVSQGVYGNALDNIITMGDGGDLVVLEGGGDDSVFGNGGDDFLYFGSAFTAADKADGGEGTDTVALLGNYVLTLGEQSLTGIERFTMYSSGVSGTNSYAITTVDANVAAGKQLMVVGLSLSATESLTFDGLAERDGTFNIRGGRGTDVLSGGSKDDQVYGNLGADRLAGGGGNDAFFYYEANESTLLARDTISDFSLGDKINLIGIDADNNTANGNSKFAWIGNAAFSGVAGQLRAYQVEGSWIVEGDVNGDSLADLVIGVNTVDGHIIARSDFYL